MTLHREPKQQGGPDRKRYTVYMESGSKTHYVCDMADGSGDEATAINSLGLTLRAG